MRAVGDKSATNKRYNKSVPDEAVLVQIRGTCRLRNDVVVHLTDVQSLLERERPQHALARSDGATPSGFHQIDTGDSKDNDIDHQRGRQKEGK